MPQQNGLIEHVNRTIVEVVQCMLQHQLALSTRFWGEVLNTTTYIKVQLSHKSLDRMIPEQA